jgi:hypothetical protein
LRQLPKLYPQWTVHIFLTIVKFASHKFKIRREVQIILFPILKMFILLIDNFIKKQHTQTIFMNAYYEGMNKFWSKNRNDKKGWGLSWKFILIFMLSTLLQKNSYKNLIMVQEDGKKKLVCKNRKFLFVLDGNVHAYLSSESTKFWIHYE